MSSNPTAEPKQPAGADSGTTAHGVTWAEALRTWARVAALSFGGPAGQIAVMHRIIVDEKRWISERRFLHALNYCMLLPGPEAQQLATYIGWLMHRTPGGILAGGLFVLPGAVAIMALSIVYALWGRLPIVNALFFGLKAAVLAIVVEAVLRVGRRAIGNRLLAGIAAAAFFAIYFLSIPFPLIIVAAALTGFAATQLGLILTSKASPGSADAGEPASLLGEDVPVHAKPDATRTLTTAAVWLLIWLAPVALVLLILGRHNVFGEIAVFFSKMAVVTFGGAYAALAYVAQQAVTTFHWLTPGEMLDGLGMAETTPGPLIMVLQFVGFLAAYRDPGQLSPLAAGTLGGLLATWVTFAPCFLWIFLGAPYIERLRGNEALDGALKAITAAVCGVILNLAVWFAVHALFERVVPVRFGPFAFDAPVIASVDAWGLILALWSAFAIFRLKLGMLPTLASSCAAGIGLYVLGWH